MNDSSRYRRYTNAALTDAVAHWSRIAPEASALEYEGAPVLTYERLWALSGGLARMLAAAGKGVLAIEAVDSRIAAVGIIGALRAEVDICLIDPRLPPERRRQIVKAIAPSAVFYEKRIHTPSLEEVTRIEWDALAAEPGPGPRPASTSRYFVFTSGSTAEPKAIIGNFAGVANFVRWQGETYDVSPLDRFGALTSPSFDVFLRDTLTPLAHGATIVLPPRDWLTQGLNVPSWLAEERVTVLHTVPALAKSWLSRRPDTQPNSLRRTFFAGEPLRRSLVESWLSVFPATAVTNLYGPSETTLAAFSFDLTDDYSWTHDPAPVGAPIPGVTLHILDEDHNPVREGEVGEVAIQSAYRSHGYLDPTVTATVFVDLPHLAGAGELTYLTGDRGFSSDWGLVLRGRGDDEVKIDGVRTDPRSIADTISRTLQPATECVVLVEQAGPRLVAFLKTPNGEQPDVAELRTKLAGSLVPAQIPARFIGLAALPLTANGKIDRQALLAIAARGTPARSDHAPSGLVAEMCEIWRTSVGADRVVGSDDFLDLGGSSLTALEIAGIVSDRFQVRITPVDVLERRTPSRLVDLVRSGDRVLPALPECTAHDENEIPLSPSQRFYSQIYTGELHRSGIVFVRLRLQQVPAARVHQALRFVANRHDALRTTLIHTPEGLRQLVHDPGTALPPSCRVDEVFVDDASDWTLSALRTELLAEGLPELKVLWRCVIVRTRSSGEAAALLLVLHHLICDGLSARQLRGEIAEHLDGKRHSDQAPPLRQSTNRRLAREVAPEVSAQLVYWRRYLAGAALPMQLPVTEPVTHSGEWVRRTHTGPWPARIAAGARALRTTPFAVYVAAFSIICHVLYDRDDIIMVMPISGRDVHEATTVGMFTNMVSVRHRLLEGADAAGMITGIGADLLAAQRHGDVAYDRVWQEVAGTPVTGRFPLSGALIGAMPLDRGAEPVSGGQHGAPTGRQLAFDLHAYFYESTDRIDIEIQHRTDVVPSLTADRCLDELARLIETLATEPSCRLADLIDGTEKVLLATTQ